MSKGKKNYAQSPELWLALSKWAEAMGAMSQDPGLMQVAKGAVDTSQGWLAANEEKKIKEKEEKKNNPLNPKNILKTGARVALDAVSGPMAPVTDMAFNAADQALSNGKVDWGNVAMGGVTSYAGSKLGDLATKYGAKASEASNAALDKGLAAGQGPTAEAANAATAAAKPFARKANMFKAMSEAMNVGNAAAKPNPADFMPPSVSPMLDRRYAADIQNKWMAAQSLATAADKEAFERKMAEDKLKISQGELGVQQQRAGYEGRRTGIAENEDTRAAQLFPEQQYLLHEQGTAAHLANIKPEVTMTPYGETSWFPPGVEGVDEQGNIITGPSFGVTHYPQFLQVGPGEKVQPVSRVTGAPMGEGIASQYPPRSAPGTDPTLTEANNANAIRARADLFEQVGQLSPDRLREMMQIPASTTDAWLGQVYGLFGADAIVGPTVTKIYQNYLMGGRVAAGMAGGPQAALLAQPPAAPAPQQQPGGGPQTGTQPVTSQSGTTKMVKGPDGKWRVAK